MPKLFTTRQRQTAYKDLMGRFITPTTIGRQRGLIELEAGWDWGMDNGAWAGFKPDIFMKMLKLAQPYRDTCRFVAAPDQPSANWTGSDPLEPFRITMNLFEKWQPIIADHGLPVALCVHPGATPENIPWHKVDALFIGGTDLWRYGGKGARIKRQKRETECTTILHAANERGKYVHGGRMANSIAQIEWAAHFRIRSYDGTCEIRQPDKFMQWYLPAIERINNVYSQ